MNLDLDLDLEWDLEWDLELDNISGPRWATEKLWYAQESSATADSKTPLTFIPTSILRGSMALQSQRSFFCGHPVVLNNVVKFEKK